VYHESAPEGATMDSIKRKRTDKHKRKTENQNYLEPN